MNTNYEIQYKSVRTIDNSGRFVLPADLRKTLGIKGGDTLIITSTADAIHITKA